MIVSQIFSSVGIGLLIGILLGLSASPVVGLVVGSVTALLASLIGANIPTKSGEQATAERVSQEQIKLIGIRAGVFGLTCVVGIFAGIYMRTHNMLSPPKPTLKQLFEELTDIGFDTQGARELVAARIANTEPSNRKNYKKIGVPIGELQNTVLFSIDSGTCEKIAIDRFENISAAISYYRTMELHSLLKIAIAVNQHVTDERAKMDIMRSILKVLCEKE